MQAPALLALAALALGTGCDRRAPITACSDELRGVYRVLPAAGATEDPADVQRWMILDSGRALEAYPLFDDTPPAAAGLEIAPRVLDLARTSD
ncbi:MAG: hypothetical protein M3680_32370, partial [Myxococcota bacterium]|nr:hypothetical protein [Myxococcota bacterium]